MAWRLAVSCGALPHGGGMLDQDWETVAAFGVLGQYFGAMRAGL
jgi:hypothetical protein